MRALRAGHTDAQVSGHADDFAPVRPVRPRRKDPDPTRPMSRAATARSAVAGLVNQVRPVPASSVGRPEQEVAAPDAGWWTLARLDSALVATADGSGLAWLRRDRGEAGAALVDAVRVHRELLARWPQLSASYRRALPDLVGQDAWRRTLGVR